MTRAAILVVVAVAVPSAAVAQDARTAVLETTVDGDRVADLGPAAGRIVRARIEALQVAEIIGTPALDLADLQLAVGCVGETVQCLDGVARQLEVDELVIPSLSGTGDLIVAGVLRFSRDGGGRVRRAARRTTDEEEALDSFDGMLRELYDLPEPPQPQPESDSTRAPEPDTPATDAELGPVDFEPPLVSFVVAGAGVVTMIAGAIVGAVAASTEDEYAAAPTSTQEEVDAARELLDTAETDATIANVLLGVGAAAAITGVVLFFTLGDDEETEPELAFTPYADDRSVGLAVSGSFGGRR